METWGDWAYLHDLVKAGGEALKAGEVPEPSILHEICTRSFPSQRLLLHSLLRGYRDRPRRDSFCELSLLYL